MYGLLVGALQHFVESLYGADIWIQALNLAEIDYQSINTHSVYAETIIPRIVNALSSILNEAEEDIMFHNGCYFVEYLSTCGYDKILRVLGRNFVDFIQGLDNLHEYLRFSYPKIKPPSFNVESVTESTIKLHYRTKRPGFQHYVRGQLVNIAKYFYEKDIKIFLISKIEDSYQTHYTFDILLDMKGFEKTLEISIPYENFPIRRDMFFEIFPFHLVLSENLTIQHCGVGFKHICPTLLNSNFNDEFILSKPFIDATYEKIVRYNNSNFEIILMPHTSGGPLNAALKKDKANIKRLSSIVQGRIKFKGQMLDMPLWNGLMFLGTPVIRDVKQLKEAGLFLNDLNKFDTGKDIILAGSQQSDELMELFEKQLEKSKQLEENMRDLNKFRKKTDELLYQCIPKSIAKRLRKGVSSMDTCQVYFSQLLSRTLGKKVHKSLPLIHQTKCQILQDVLKNTLQRLAAETFFYQKTQTNHQYSTKVFQSVSICFSKVVDFVQICSEISVDKIVNLLNDMYTHFDNLTELYKVYKVETISDSYMLVSGAPSTTDLHSAHIVEMALSMITCAKKNLKNPAKSSGSIELLIGCHSGMIVAGIVGIKMPRYCLFGDTVNTSSRMMSHGSPNKVHVSDIFFEHISQFPYNYTKRGEMEIKGKGSMTTYFIESRKSGDEYKVFKQKLEEDRLMHDDSPDDSLSLCSRINSGFILGNSVTVSYNHNASTSDEENITDSTISKEDVFKEALRLLSEQEVNGNSKIAKYEQSYSNSNTLRKREKSEEIYNHLIHSKSNAPLRKESNIFTEDLIQDINDNNLPQSIMKSVNSRRKKGIVYFGQEKFISPSVSAADSTADINSASSNSSNTNSDRTIENYLNGREVYCQNSENNQQIPLWSNLSKCLIKGLAIIANQRPSDPIEALAIWLKSSALKNQQDDTK